MKNAASWYHDNRDHMRVTCEHCGGVVHEPWCISLNAVILYAYQIVADADADRLTFGDQLILHALGVKWDGCRDTATVPS